MPVGTSDGQYFENIYDYHKRTSDAKEMAANETSGDFQSRFGAVDTAPRMPPGASEKLTGAFESFSGTQVPGRQYETGLTKLEEQKFSEWKTQYAPKDSGEDYDFRGAFKAGVTPAENGHWPDTFKKPNHPTFSIESQYAKDRPELAGRWDGEIYIPPARGVWDKLTGQTGERYQLWPEKAIRGIIEGVEAFGGKTPTWAMDPTTGEVRTDMQTAEKVFDAAGLAVFGPMPVAKKMVDGTLGSFAGVRSQTINKKALYKAQELEMMEGRGNQEVWEQTGFFRGADNRWRYEIPDNTSNLKLDQLDYRKSTVNNPTGWTSPLRHGETTETVGVPDITYWDQSKTGLQKMETRLEDVLDHPELYAAYPHLKDTKLFPMPEGNKSIGFARPWNNEIYMSNLPPKEFKEVLHHEIQHIIQEHEGFAKGGNDKMFTPKGLEEATQQFEKAKADFRGNKNLEYLNYKGVIESEVNGNLEKFEPKLAEAIKARIQEAKDKGVYESIKNIVKSEKLLAEQREKQYEQYMRLMGEVEARNVALRSSMDWMERNYKSPMSTESRPRYSQIDPNP